jgi:hypothetical protein
MILTTYVKRTVGKFTFTERGLFFLSLQSRILQSTRLRLITTVFSLFKDKMALFFAHDRRAGDTVVALLIRTGAFKHAFGPLAQIESCCHAISSLCSTCTGVTRSVLHDCTECTEDM